MGTASRRKDLRKAMRFSGHERNTGKGTRYLEKQIMAQTVDHQKVLLDRIWRRAAELAGPVVGVDYAAGEG